ncbi:MAG TPA: hypothetical protein VLQ78_13535 [Ornithinibacter sp.]|nr:hypothetical protein [Ornithinibacter sp.]
MTTTTPRTPAAATTRRALRAWLLWTAGFVAFPVAGIAGIVVAGRVDAPAAAALGGLATGAVLGLGQALAGSRRLPILRWVVATAAAMAVGLPAGAHLVGYGTSLPDLVVMGAVTGAFLGPVQALALPDRARHRWAWAVAMPALWAAGWAVTTSAGIAVTDQFTIFGASGAVTVTAVLGVLLHAVVPPGTDAPDHVESTSTTTTGDRA